MEKARVYLAGRPSAYERNWKEAFKDIQECDFYDWEIHSDQTSPDTFFPEDLQGVASSSFLIANPGTIPAEATWLEVGFFYANNVGKPGDFCDNLIVIWADEREPKWSIDFIRKAGHIVGTVQEAKDKLRALVNKGN